MISKGAWNIATIFVLQAQNKVHLELIVMWRPIEMRVFHQNESCLSCPHPPLSYEGRREQEGSPHFDETLSF